MRWTWSLFACRASRRCHGKQRARKPYPRPTLPPQVPDPEVLLPNIGCSSPPSTDLRRLSVNENYEPKNFRQLGRMSLSSSLSYDDESLALSLSRRSSKEHVVRRSNSGLSVATTICEPELSAIMAKEIGFKPISALVAT